MFAAGDCEYQRIFLDIYEHAVAIQNLSNEDPSRERVLQQALNCTPQRTRPVIGVAILGEKKYPGGVREAQSNSAVAQEVTDLRQA